jgi:hypothetical protein
VHEERDGGCGACESEAGEETSGVRAPAAPGSVLIRVLRRRARETGSGSHAAGRASP